MIQKYSSRVAGCCNLYGTSQYHRTYGPGLNLAHALLFLTFLYVFCFTGGNRHGLFEIFCAVGSATQEILSDWSIIHHLHYSVAVLTQSLLLAYLLVQSAEWASLRGKVITLTFK